MADLATFTKKIRDYDSRVVLALVEIQKAVAIKAYQMIATDSTQSGFKFGSPVWSGRYRASHNLSIGTPDYSIKPPHPDTTGKGATRWPDDVGNTYNSPPVSLAAQRLRALQPFDIVYIANGLPYARRIELGHSKFKAPEGVYDVTAVAVRAIFKQSILKQTLRNLGL